MEIDILVGLTDCLSEAIAAAHDYEGPHAGDALENLLEVNRELWRLRWEIGLARHNGELPFGAEGGAVKGHGKADVLRNEDGG